MVLEHLLGNRRTFPNALIRVYIEANMSFVDSKDMADLIGSTPGLMGDIVDVVKYDPKGLGRTGIWTSHASKERWSGELTRCIDTMRTVEPKRFVTQLHSDEEDVSQIQVNLLCEQLLQMRKFMVAPKNSADSMQLFAKRGITGKSPGKKDDRVAALCIAIIHMIKDCFTNPALTSSLSSPPIAFEDTSYVAA